jgi:hypothetical protein
MLRFSLEDELCPRNYRKILKKMVCNFLGSVTAMCDKCRSTWYMARVCIVVLSPEFCLVVYGPPNPKNLPTLSLACLGVQPFTNSLADTAI